MISTKWIPRYGARTETPPELALWAEQLEISAFLAEMLWQRGLQSKSEMAFFVNPGLRYLVPLSNWPGLEKAAQILADGLIAGKKLVVWGDYDVDGITSSALVLHFLAMHGYSARCHIPCRLEEGYGMNVPKLEELAAQGFDMLLTVDCGISDYEPVKRAKELGFTVVVSDHHLPGETLPEADAVCAPTIGECECQSLAGVGVAFLLMAGVNNRLAEQTGKKVDIRPLLDLVALGTLADVVNLCGQNRILVKNGLLYLNKASRPGIAALKSVCKISPSAEVNAGQVVFTLAPRINAAGRLSRSEVALRLLLTEDRVEAAQLAAELESFNRQRRSEEEQIVEEAREMAAGQVAEGRMGLVLYGPHWHMGIIGIVASRMVEEFHRPTIILCDNGTKIKGSGRSLENFDLHSALSGCADLFLAFGGHRMAAGLTLKAEELEAFRQRFDAKVKETLGLTAPPLSVKIDSELSLDKASDFTLLKELEMLQPFGMGNPEPVFASNALILRNVRAMSGLTIIDVQDQSSGVTLKAKLWRPKRDILPNALGKKIKLAYSPRIDRYNGIATVELRVKDWQMD